MPPPDPSPQKLREGQVIQSQHVTVEINTVFQQLVNVLDKIDPAKLNETLGAIATAFDGRGEKFGQTLVDFNALLAKIEPSLPNLSHDIEASVPTLNAYADAAPDLVSTIQNTTTVEQLHRRSAAEPRRVPGQRNRSGRPRQRGGRRQPPGTDRCGAPARAHHRHCSPSTTTRCGAASAASSRSRSLRRSTTRSSCLPVCTLGVERYRYPGDLPKVAAKSGGANYCEELGLPELPANFVPPFVAGDVGSNPAQYGNQGILLNSDALKNWLFGPIDGPPRNTPQIGQPG